MKITEVIKELKEIKKSHGNIDCFVKVHGQYRQKLKSIIFSNIESFPFMASVEEHVSLED